MIKTVVGEAVQEAMQAQQEKPPSPVKPVTGDKPTYKTKLDTSKKLLYFITALYAVSWVIVVVTLLVHGETPWELIRYTTLLFTAECVVYGCKSAYENKPKIERDWGDRP